MIWLVFHDDVIKWKHFPRYWPFARRIHRSPANSPHKGQWRGAFDIFFDLNKRLSKQSWGLWSETQSCSLWRHSNVSWAIFSIQGWARSRLTKEDVTYMILSFIAFDIAQPLIVIASSSLWIQGTQYLLSSNQNTTRDSRYDAVQYNLIFHRTQKIIR